MILEADLINIHTVSQILKHAFTTLHTGGTVSAVSSQQKLHDQLSVFSEPVGIGIDDHTIPGLLRAGSKQFSSVILHCTQTACAEGRKL